MIHRRTSDRAVPVYETDASGDRILITTESLAEVDDVDDVEAAVAQLLCTYADERPDLGETPVPDVTPCQYRSRNHINVVNRSQLK